MLCERENLSRKVVLFKNRKKNTEETLKEVEEASNGIFEGKFMARRQCRLLFGVHKREAKGGKIYHLK
jgi:hypothetical protein